MTHSRQAPFPAHWLERRGRFQWLSPERRANLEALGQTLARSKTGVVGTLALFVFSPLPSAQLFMAAGLADVPLLPLAAAFLIGRSISYTIYITAATAAQENSSADPAPRPDIALRDRDTAGQPRRCCPDFTVDWIKIIDRTRARVARLRGKPAPRSVGRPISISRAATQRESQHDLPVSPLEISLATGGFLVLVRQRWAGRG